MGSDFTATFLKHSTKLAFSINFNYSLCIWFVRRSNEMELKFVYFEDMDLGDRRECILAVSSMFTCFPTKICFLATEILNLIIWSRKIVRTRLRRCDLPHMFLLAANRALHLSFVP